MTTFKKIWKFLSSMRFAILLLVILALACSAGSFITQGQTYQWYSQRYSARMAGWIVALHLDDAFHSGWFIAITAFLCLNLLLCNVLRLPQLIRRTRAEGDVESALRGNANAQLEHVSDPVAMFRRLRMPAPKKCAGAEGREVLFASKNRIGLWGAWACHLGILLLILGFGLGQMTQRQYTVYGVAGQSKSIGDTGLAVTIDDFRVDLRDDDTVEQYTADITVRSLTDAKASPQSASIRVNHPATLFGMKFYQNSTGWAAKASVALNGETIQEEVLCAGEYLRVKDKQDLVIYLNAFYPDYVLTSTGPATASGKLNNPSYLYSVYYQDSMLGMNALKDDEVLTIDDYTVTFSEPQSYTLIQIKRDSFTWLALVGGLIVLIGLALALYVQPTRALAVRQADGLWTVSGACPKGGALFQERFAKAAEAAKEDPHAAG